MTRTGKNFERLKVLQRGLTGADVREDRSGGPSVIYLDEDIRDVVILAMPLAPWVRFG